MSTCYKDHLFSDALPTCLRKAAVRLDIEVTRGRSKGQTATVEVCDPCASLLTLRTPGIRVVNRSLITEATSP